MSVSTDRPLNCSFNCLFRQTTTTNIKALHYWPFVRGIHQLLVDSPHKWPVIQNRKHLHIVTSLWDALWIIWDITAGISLGMHAPSQWETSLQCNDVSHWLGTYWDWSLYSMEPLYTYICVFVCFVEMAVPQRLSNYFLCAHKMCF